MLRPRTRCPGARQSLKPLPPDRLERLRRWAADYDRAVRADQPASLPAIGRDIAALLNDDGWLESCLRESTGDIALEIRVPADPPDPEEQALAAALLDVPWELLTSPGRTGPALLLDFLALDDTRLFRVARRIGPPPPDTPQQTPPAPGDLTLLFMAA
ncbi:hypothetical protein JL100_019580 [Skermanella mucosa]|uniref:hypothetical protein n=1 Tax=Skermanella mucosa TaxID=1789672 RepID=UPI00192C85ED|nr:hypothetical protein [Skermanella mucosa]UEM19282.1 hypothetical protein JL100_019580 [Skermanella mucosa]